MLELERIRQSDLIRNALKPQKKSSKRRSPAWDMRNAVATTTTPERLELDPARACHAPT